MTSFAEKFGQGATIAAGRIVKRPAPTYGNLKKNTKAVFKACVKQEKRNRRNKVIFDLFKGLGF